MGVRRGDLGGVQGMRLVGSGAKLPEASDAQIEDIFSKSKCI